jgi:hypothetical protein
MATQDNTQLVLDFFDHNRSRLQRIIPPLLKGQEDPDAVIEEAAGIYASFVTDEAGCAYVDDPHSVFAGALFYCNVNLAAYLAVKARGVDVHTFGTAVLTDLAATELPAVPADAAPVSMTSPGTHPGEFITEVVGAEADQTDWGYNVKSCAICYQYGRYDAMALVPYMCASDDVISDKRGEGLRRDGTIALGAHQCDFRYKAGGEPRRVAEAFPDKIKFVHSD